MKRKILLFSIVSFILLFTISSCKKDNSSDTNDTNTEIAAQSDDQAQVSAELDAVADDADALVTSEASMSGRVLSICDASAVAEISGDIKKITITYDGTNCRGNRKRTGTVILSMPKNAYWKNAGATITIQIQNLKITRLWDNKSITINGSETITNVTGGLLVNLSSQLAVTHKIESDGITVAFDNNTQRSWQVAVQRAFTYNNGLVITETGLHTEGNVTGIAIWGTNRFGSNFSASIASPLVVRQDCDFRLVSGTIVHTRNAITTTTTFGLDEAGVATSCPGTGRYYLKIVWTASAGNSLSLILPY